jgi:predicted Fe-Mo cluster-binding NifX family protein
VTTGPEAGQALQAQTLDVIRKSQETVAQAVEQWANAAAKATTDVGVPMTQVPSTGDPAAVLDSVFDFAGQLLELNKAFAHRLLSATQTAQVGMAQGGQEGPPPGEG